MHVNPPSSCRTVHSLRLEAHLHAFKITLPYNAKVMPTLSLSSGGRRRPDTNNASAGQEETFQMVAAEFEDDVGRTLKYICNFCVWDAIFWLDTGVY